MTRMFVAMAALPVAGAHVASADWGYKGFVMVRCWDARRLS